ncbi:probable 1-acyl-sn-glycerol-3-phosphate acyltransferase 5 [Ipomoea triloba]|uniref:probable 1-acyl-sn-glycerol-3-phosphate acyltransferase 5 n=1 Tax=Ipomoea triloba TaxID=35885 RepID=UPI00125DEB55|nr:probable 1-acyl-sn-glycerol-3-phosphate acyltransferase 5 [Ipomoea triloba]XP_031125805.1 probable 1-acyl-sn-glycerol-3-phosphate acyltransferase 5 [Ipomoea triloba]
MDVQAPCTSRNRPRHQPLTPFRVVRGVLCLVVLILTAFMLLVFCGFWAVMGLRFFSVHYSRTTTAFFFGCWIALWPFLFEKVNKTKVVFSGDCVPNRERVLLIANHRTEVDWMYLWDLALRKGCVGSIRYILKSSLMKLPVFGWVFHVMEFIPVERKWEADESKLRRMLSSYTDRKDPLWLAVFPEGTDFTEQKCIRSQKYASENGLPILKHVLLPKTKGFCACLEELRGSLDAVYDLTIGYKHNCPSFLDNAFGVDPAEVHIHIRRIALSDIPHSENEAASWLMDTFSRKDQLLRDFYSQGHFPREGIEGELSMWKCLLNFAFVVFLTGVCTFLTLFASVWFKIYVTTACALLATATYFNFRPSPIVCL